MRRIISVFGSSAPRAGDPAYAQAHEVGRLLAERGYALATGGYSGTMEAASEGASKAGGHVIGVTAAQIERFRPLGPNPYVAEVVRYDTLRERLIHLVVNNAGMIVLPGGVGTLSEMTLAWSFLQVGEIPSCPLVLLGNIWRETMTVFVRAEHVSTDHQALLQFATTPAEAVSMVANWRASGSHSSP